MNKNFLKWLGLCAGGLVALGANAPRAAADSILVVGQSTFLDINVETVHGSTLIVDVPLTEDTSGFFFHALAEGKNLPTVEAELLYPGTSDPAIDIFLSDVFVAGVSISPNLNNEKVTFEFEKVKYEFFPPPQNVPEPGSLGMLGAGLLGLAAIAKTKSLAA